MKKIKNKLFFYCILGVEVFLMIFLCFGRLRSQENDYFEYSADMLMMAQDNEDGLEVREGTACIESEDQGQNRRIITPDFTVRSGIYAVSVQYHSDISSISSTGCWSQAIHEGEYPWVQSESAFLTNNAACVEYFVYVTKGNTDIKIKNIMDDGIYDAIRIDQITVTYLNGRSAVVMVITLLFIFGLIDVLMYVGIYQRQAMEKWLSKKGLIVVALGVLLFVVELPMMMNHIPKGYDLRFHYYRIYSIAEGLRNGIFPVKIQPEWFNGYGYAVGVFYGDLFLYMPAALYLLGFSLGTAYKIYILMVNVITIGSSYYCFKTISKDRCIGLFGAIVYTSSLHRLVALYTRAALGAFTALAFLPFILLGLWVIYYGDDKEYRNGWIYLVIGATGIVESHLLGTLMTILFVILFMAVSPRLTFRKKTGIALGKAVVGCLLANLFYLVPFLDMYRSMELAVKDYTGNMPLSFNSAFVSQIFSTSFDAVADVKADLYGMYQDMPMSVGPVSGIIILIAVCFLVYYYKKVNSDFLVKLLILTCIFLWMSTNLFPYMWLDEFCPVLYSGLKNFEFAWRFLAIATMLIALLYVVLMEKAKIFWERKRVLIIGGIISILFCWQGASYLFQCNNMIIPFEYEDSFRDLTMRAIYDGAYMPAGTDYREMTSDIKTSERGAVTVKLLSRAGTSMQAMIKNHGEEEDYIEFPILYYQGYHAQYDEGELVVEAGTNNRLKVIVPAGFDNVVNMAFTEPWYWRGAEIISLLFGIGLISFLLIEKRGKVSYNEKSGLKDRNIGENVPV